MDLRLSFASRGVCALPPPLPIMFLSIGIINRSDRILHSYCAIS
ncbi:superoxide dismutase domain protein, partial [Escherichia coli 96.0427]